VANELQRSCFRGMEEAKKLDDRLEDTTTVFKLRLELCVYASLQSI